MPMVLLGYFLGALFFTGLFQGGVLEALTAGAAGVVAGLCVMGLSKLEVNFFFKTIAAAAVLGMVIYGLRALGLPVDTGIAAISALMVLVPGLVFTNFMCDLITGDMVSGLSTFVRAVLTATAIAIGTGVALGLFQTLGLAAEGVGNREDYGAVLQCLAAFLACSGFCVMYNVHGWGVVLCCLGGALGWAVYLAMGMVTGSIYLRYLVAGIAIAAYAEAMAPGAEIPHHGLSGGLLFSAGARLVYLLCHVLCYPRPAAAVSGVGDPGPGPGQLPGHRDSSGVHHRAHLCHLAQREEDEA